MMRSVPFCIVSLGREADGGRREKATAFQLGRLDKNKSGILWTGPVLCRLCLERLRYVSSIKYQISNIKCR